MNFLFSFIVGALSCVGFCLIINCPRRSIIAASIVGGLGWTTYQYLLATGSTKAMSAFIASCLVALLSDFSSRKFKESAIVFIIPGILPLVPGAGLYYTMRELINSNYDKAAATAQTTFFIAGAIALALLMMGSFIKVITSIIHKIK